jgi:hypothetical protein
MERGKDRFLGRLFPPDQTKFTADVPARAEIVKFLPHSRCHRFIMSVSLVFTGDHFLDRRFSDGERIPGMQGLSGVHHVHTDEVRVPTLRQRDRMIRPMFSRLAGIEENRNRLRMKRLARVGGRNRGPVRGNGIALGHPADPIHVRR